MNRRFTARTQPIPFSDRPAQKRLLKLLGVTRAQRQQFAAQGIGLHEAVMRGLIRKPASLAERDVAKEAFGEAVATMQEAARQIGIDAPTDEDIEEEIRAARAQRRGGGDAAWGPGGRLLRAPY
jgi:hypothetical protein